MADFDLFVYLQNFNQNVTNEKQKFFSTQTYTVD